MKKPSRVIAIAVTIPCILLSFLYIILLMLSSVVALPFQVEDNVLFTDWFFLVIPVLALLSSIFLQVASLQKKNKQNG